MRSSDSVAMERALPDVIALLRSMLRQDVEGMRLVFDE